MTKAVFLLTLAFISMLILFLPLFTIQVARYLWLLRLRPLLPKFLFGLAKAFDYLFAYLILGIFNHTVSALVFKKQVGWAINGIDWIFGTFFNEPNHCMQQFLYEFKKKEDHG